MIIECPACSKKFNIDEKLIPNEGRLLKCGNCDHTWFYKKKENLILETETIKINEIKENKSEINIEPVDVPIKQTKKIAKVEKIKTLEGKRIYLPAKSICIHGDKEEALNQAKAIKKGLIENSFELVNLNQI